MEVTDMKTKVAIVEDNGPLRQTFSQWVSQGDGLTLVGAFENAERTLA
jgi:hypothetical protein